MGWYCSDVVIFDLTSGRHDLASGGNELGSGGNDLVSGGYNLVCGGNNLVSGGNKLVMDGYDWKHKDLLSCDNHLVSWWPWAPSSRSNKGSHT